MPAAHSAPFGPRTYRLHMNRVIHSNCPRDRSPQLPPFERNARKLRVAVLETLDVRAEVGRTVARLQNPRGTAARRLSFLAAIRLIRPRCSGGGTSRNHQHRSWRPWMHRPIVARQNTPVSLAFAENLPCRLNVAPPRAHSPLQPPRCRSAHPSA